jgi:hypothetical protein
MTMELPEFPRELTNHRCGNAANDSIMVGVLDEPGAGGACHEYMVCVPVAAGADEYEPTLISFQNGPIAEAGINGLTHEALLAILIDRLRSFQAGPFACFENMAALANCEDALNHLHARTRARLERGVEGTHQV